MTTPLQASPSTRESSARNLPWRATQLRQAAAVRRALRAARSGGNAVIGIQSTKEALIRGNVIALLVTRRFAGFNDDTATMLGQAMELGAPVTPITGVAELELDLVADGVAAVLRPRCADALSK